MPISSHRSHQKRRCTVPTRGNTEVPGTEGTSRSQRRKRRASAALGSTLGRARERNESCCTRRHRDKPQRGLGAFIPARGQLSPADERERERFNLSSNQSYNVPLLRLWWCTSNVIPTCACSFRCRTYTCLCTWDTSPIFVSPSGVTCVIKIRRTAGYEWTPR